MAVIIIGSPKNLTRFSYAHVFEPQEDKNGKLKYSVSLIIPKEDTKTIESVKAGIAAAMEEGKSMWGKVGKGTNLKNPLRDGDEEKDDPAYKGCYFINASSYKKPDVYMLVKENGKAKQKPIVNEGDFYSGCYGIASVNFYPFKTDDGTAKGVACGLSNVLKIKDGVPLSGGTTAEDDFDELLGEFDDLDLDDYEDDDDEL